MKKIAFILVTIAFIVVPGFVLAGFSSNNATLLTRLEVSKDGTNWVNYVAETNPGNQTLTVSPGDTIFLRLKTWDTAEFPAFSVQYTGSYTDQQYIDAIDAFHSGNADDLDGHGLLYQLNAPPDMSAGTLDFSLQQVNGDTTDSSGFESGGIVARVKAGTPDQTVIVATVQITSVAQGQFTRLNNLSPKAYADDQATTQVRILVSNPPATQTQPPISSTRIGK